MVKMIKLSNHVYDYTKAYDENFSGGYKNRIIMYKGGRSCHLAAEKIQKSDNLFRKIKLFILKYFRENIAFGNDVYLIKKHDLFKTLNIDAKVYEKASIEKRQKLIAAKIDELVTENVLPARKIRKRNEDSEEDIARRSIESDISDDTSSSVSEYDDPITRLLEELEKDREKNDKYTEVDLDSIFDEPPGSWED